MASTRYVCAHCSGNAYKIYVDADDGYVEKDPCPACVGATPPKPCLVDLEILADGTIKIVQVKP